MREGCDDITPPFIRTRSHRTQPSFSSSLLDAIYRSIDKDESDSFIHTSGNQLKPLDYSRTTKKPVINRSTRCDPCPVSTPTVRRTAPVNEKLNVKSRDRFNTAGAESSSSSDGSSSCNSFSSWSEPESNTSMTPRLKPVRTKIKPVRSNEKIKKSSPPPSPGARIAGLISSLVSAATPKKKNRSVMNAETEEMKQRSFRLAAEESEIGVDDKLRRRGVYGRCTTMSVVEQMVRSRMEKLMAAMEDERDRNRNNFEEFETGSDSSTDLFELDNLDISTSTDLHDHGLPVSGSIININGLRKF